MDSDYVFEDDDDININNEDDDDDENDDDVEFQEQNQDESWSDSSSVENSGKNKRKSCSKKKKSTTIKSSSSSSSKITNRKNSKKMSTSSINPEYIADIKQTFKRFDIENQGRFDIKQLKFAMRALGFEPKKEEVQRISEEYNKDGFILYNDFEQLMIKRITEKNVNDEIMKAFQLFDTNQTGKITFDDLKRVSNELGEKITDDELMEMIQEADLDGDKAVDCQEFLRIMKKTFLY
ncbi:Centrin-1 [Dermatophagoides pteronyssinus]|uniref:Centrin-1 n=1 Tax=Dermatophagoides pteronyssinus TaxID=6956 RepID=A0ABQ8JM58_DERPT|nr:Centrin-1 [Dermatophagoides pteronyssinus]